MKSMFWTNEKLSLIVAGASSVSITCSKVQSSGGNSWCPCSSAHEIRELSEWSDILSWDLEHNLPQVELISIVGCSAFTELSPSLGSFIELWNISFGFLSILSPSDENIDLRQAFQFHILMTLRAARTEQPAVAEMPTHSFVQPVPRLKPWASQQAPRWVNQIWGE